MTSWNPKETLDSIGLSRTAVKRSVRVADAVRNELAVLLVSKVRDQKLSGVSISRVELTDDLKLCRVFYTVLDGRRGGVQKGLEGARGFMRSHLAKTINMRYTPALQFIYDDSVDKVRELDDIFEEIAIERERKKHGA
ncbi:MAG: ribosome-binding factor A [Deltaproteobacteria bacterium]|nr:MAG: ribosome-binding factor A [Deltaproteobacteria bacterium]